MSLDFIPLNSFSAFVKNAFCIPVMTDVSLADEGMINKKDLGVLCLVFRRCSVFGTMECRLNWEEFGDRRIWPSRNPTVV